TSCVSSRPAPSTPRRACRATNAWRTSACGPPSATAAESARLHTHGRLLFGEGVVQEAARGQIVVQRAFEERQPGDARQLLLLGGQHGALGDRLLARQTAPLGRRHHPGILAFESRERVAEGTRLVRNDGADRGTSDRVGMRRPGKPGYGPGKAG